MPRSFLVKKMPSSCSQLTGTATASQQASDSRYDGVVRNRDDVTVTSPTNTNTETVVAAVVNHAGQQSSIGSNQIVSRWLLVTKRPDVGYWLENSATNLPSSDDYRRRIDDVMSLCGGGIRSQQPQQRRSPLTILFGSTVTSTVTAPPRPRPAEAVAAPPWRPFSVHEDRPAPLTPSLSTTAGGNCTNSDLRREPIGPAPAVSAVNEVDQTVPQHHAVPRSAVGQQYTATDFLPGISFVPVLPDGLYSQLAIDQFGLRRWMGSVRQQVVDAGCVTCCPTAATARQQCSQCSLVFSTLADLVRHQQSSCGCPSKSSPSSSSPAQSASTGSPPTRSPSPLRSCPHCDKTYTSSGALKMHVRTHTLPCRCPTCGKAFSRPWLLQGHLRTHTGERPFRCAVCGRAFADRSNLRAHAQTHSAAKRYQCAACRRSFSRLSLLVRHERHTTFGCCGGRYGNDDAVRATERNKQ